MKDILFTVIILSLIMLVSSCSAGRMDAAEHFCPPSELLIDTPLWMLDVGGNGGLAIKGCGQNNSTCALPHEVASAVVTEKDDAADWSWESFQGGAFYGSETSRAVADKHFNFYDHGGDNILVISLPEGRGGIDLYWLVSSNFRENGMRLDDSLLAVCPAGDDVRAVRYGCDRMYRMGPFDVKYRFNGVAINGANMLAIDNGVASAFHAWRCR
jgi:hypothetical protein